MVHKLGKPATCETGPRSSSETSHTTAATEELHVLITIAQCLRMTGDEPNVLFPFPCRFKRYHGAVLATPRIYGYLNASSYFSTSQMMRAWRRTGPEPPAIGYLPSIHRSTSQVLDCIRFSSTRALRQRNRTRPRPILVTTPEPRPNYSSISLALGSKSSVSERQNIWN